MKYKLKDSDIATVEAMLDLLLDNKVLVLDDVAANRAIALVKKMHGIIDEYEKVSQYDKEGNAKHYDSQRLNSIIKFERTYGTLAVMTFCEINADKYRERIGKKPGQSLEQEVMKIKWYENAAAFYKNNILGTKFEVVIDNSKKKDLPWS